MTVNRFRDGEFAEVNRIGQPLEDASVKVRRADEWDEIWPTDELDDSAVYRQPWGEGSGTTVSDVIGDKDGSINGAQWFNDDNLEHDFGLSFDGIDDNVTSDQPDEIETNPNFMFAITVELKSLDGRQVIAQIGGESVLSDEVGFVLGSLDEDIYFRWESSENVQRARDEATTDRVRLSAYGDNGSDMRLYVNGNRLDTEDESETIGSSATEGVWIGSNNEGEDPTEMDADHPIIYHEPDSPDDVAESDYEAQPWS